MGTESWTLAELVARVEGALSAGYDGQQSRRVTEVPDVRAIRYYTTLGLLDRPASMRGRTALYGDRHLWQLVAIKRLQADGRTLAEIQREIAGAPDVTLRRLAAIPDESFWRRVPAPPTGPPIGSAAPEHDDPLAAYQAVTLDGGAIVLIPHRGTFTDRDIAALRTAASPLITAITQLTKGRP